MLGGAKKILIFTKEHTINFSHKNKQHKKWDSFPFWDLPYW